MITVAALYNFARFADPVALAETLRPICEEAGIRGTLLFAREGINGTIAGPRDGIDTVVAAIRALPGCADLDVKYSTAGAMPFGKLKLRQKREIVTMGQPDIDPLTGTGHYVAPADWNALIDDPDTIVIDTRNDYEVAIGSFARAIDPHTASFGEFPGWFDANRDELSQPGKRIAMFCTGGIRCEKATALLRNQGIDEVYHLKGGILKYLEDVPAEQSRWHGECFVFDQRVAVGHGLAAGTHSMCSACGRPLGPEDRASPLYAEGEHCPYCHGNASR